MRDYLNTFIVAPWRNLWPGHLSAVLMAWLVGSILVAEAIWLIPAYINESRQVWRSAESEIRKLMRVAVDPLAAHSLVSEKAIYRRLRNFAGFSGMRIEDGSGQTLSVLGDKPRLTSLEARQQSIRSRASQDGKFLDVYFSDAETQLQHHLVARVDMSEYFAEVGSWLRDTLTAIAVITVLLLSIGYAALYFGIVGPVSRMHKAMSEAMVHVEKGQAIQIDISRTDEIGDIAGFINRMLRELARSYSTSVAIANRATDDSKIATIVYNRANEPVFASKGALQLFGVDDLTKITSGDERFMEISRNGKIVECNLEQSFANGPFVAEVSLPLQAGRKKLLGFGHLNSLQGGHSGEKTLQFADAGLLYSRIDSLTKERDREATRRKEQERLALTTRLTLESCMILMEPDASMKPLSGGVVELAEIIRAWAQQRGSAGLGRPIRYNELPRISGNQDQIAAIFNQALGYLDFRSVFDASEIRVVATARGGMVYFELSEKAVEDRTLNARAASGGSEEWTLCFAALNRMVSLVGGSVENKPQKPGLASIAFSLPKILGSRSFDPATHDVGDDTDAAA